MGPSLARLVFVALFTVACATADGGDPFGAPVDDLGAGKDSSLVGDDATRDAPSGCTRDDDCAGSLVGPVCDTASGRCGACSTANDRCAPGFSCDADSLTCARACSKMRGPTGQVLVGIGSRRAATVRRRRARAGCMMSWPPRLVRPGMEHAGGGVACPLPPPGRLPPTALPGPLGPTRPA